MRWTRNAVLIVAVAMPWPALAAGPSATVYKNRHCGCCEAHAKYLRAHGYDVTIVSTEDLAAVKRQYRVPPPLAGCHTTIIDGYAFEGHVPVESINRFLEERPSERGLSVPGMPAGSPGMGGTKQGPLQVYYLHQGKVRLYATH